VQPLRILVVDDNRSAVDALARMLRKQGDHVQIAYDGTTAIDLIDNGFLDLILTDLKMEPVDGLAVLRAAREQLPPIETIVVTAFGAVDVAVEAMRLGARDFLTKPVTMEQIRQRLDDLRPAGPRVADDFPYVAADAATSNLLDTLRRAAGVPTPLWIMGELGVGRGYAARAIHHFSNPQAAFHTMDMEHLGPWPGSGTVLLPAIDELSLDAQRDLVRHLASAPEGVRLISTSGPDASGAMADGTLRADLYYRLAVLTVRVPPLRDRPDDILPLFHSACERYARRYERPCPPLSNSQIAMLRAQHWSGNVRELLNVAERTVVMGALHLEPARATITHTGMPAIEPGFSLQTYLEGIERAVLVEALRIADGDRREVGRLLGLERNTLRYKLNKYDLLDR